MSAVEVGAADAVAVAGADASVFGAPDEQAAARLRTATPASRVLRIIGFLLRTRLDRNLSYKFNLNSQAGLTQNNFVFGLQAYAARTGRDRNGTAVSHNA